MKIGFIGLKGGKKMIERTKEVRYDIYCKSCEYYPRSASNDPCNECLGTPSNGDSHVPVNYKKIARIINYIIPASIQVIHKEAEIPDIMYDYTRDRLKTERWSDKPPTDEELHKFFEVSEDGNYYEVLYLEKKENNEDENSENV